MTVHSRHVAIAGSTCMQCSYYNLFGTTVSIGSRRAVLVRSDKLMLYYSEQEERTQGDMTGQQAAQWLRGAAALPRSHCGVYPRTPASTAQTHTRQSTPCTGIEAWACKSCCTQFSFNAVSGTQHLTSTKQCHAMYGAAF